MRVLSTVALYDETKFPSRHPRIEYHQQFLLFKKKKFPYKTHNNNIKQHCPLDRIFIVYWEVYYKSVDPAESTVVYEEICQAIKVTQRIKLKYVSLSHVYLIYHFTGHCHLWYEERRKKITKTRRRTTTTTYRKKM